MHFVARFIVPSRWPSLLALVLLSAAVHAGELRIATWNLEHLSDADSEGCVPREAADYEAIAGQVRELDADIVAFQEVENEAAARRVFPSSQWRVEVSSRPSTGPGPPCQARSTARLGRLATGFAVRRGTAYRRGDDLSALGVGNPHLRWGTDITVTRGGRGIRLLSVHLNSGCWGATQDEDARRADTCAVLRDQMRILRGWIDARREEGVAFLILGDFNRRLAVPGDWAWGLLSPPPHRFASRHRVASPAATPASWSSSTTWFSAAARERCSCRAPSRSARAPVPTPTTAPLRPISRWAIRFSPEPLRSRW